MAVITPTYSGDKPLDVGYAGEAALITWATMANGDTGTAVQYAAYADRSVQFTGTFGSGGTVKLQGSNDGSTWADLNDLTGSSISKTAASLSGVAEATLYVRPYVSAGDGTTSITARLFVRRR